MRAALLSIALVVTACSGGAADTTTSSRVTLPALITTTEATSPPSTEAPLALCPDIETFPRVLPEQVVPGVPETSSVELDEFTLIEGAFTAIRFDADGDPVLVAIRGALPPRQFTADSEVVEILGGIPALVGPIGDGYWAAAWAIPPGDRCDLYSLIFYPPVDRDTAIEVTASVG